MADERSEKLDEITDGLDELKTLVEELAENPPPGVRRASLVALQRVIDHARDLADDLEDATK